MAKTVTLEVQDPLPQFLTFLKRKRIPYVKLFSWRYRDQPEWIRVHNYPLGSFNGIIGLNSFIDE